MKKVCIVLIPETFGLDPFMKQSGWGMADEKKCIEVKLLSCNWKEKDKADTCFESFWREQTELNDNSMVYLVGYEEGADYASLEAIMHTDRYCGLVILGGSGISEKMERVLKEKTDQQELSVWIFSSKKEDAEKKSLEYWMRKNSISDKNSTPYQVSYANELYLPRTSMAGKIPSTGNRMGIVLFSRLENYYDSSVTDQIVRYFVSRVEKDKASFPGEIDGGEVNSICDRHFSYHRLQINGQQRDYWMYLPDITESENDGIYPLNKTERNKEKCPLILCLHGNMGTGERMIDQTQWHQTAGKNHCIVLYPSSLNYKAKGRHIWLYIPEEIHFLRTLMETAIAQLPVDRSRIYVAGFSNGAGIAQNLAIRCSDLIAAVVMDAPAYYEKNCYGPIDGEIHEVATLFRYGTEDKYLHQEQLTADIDGAPARRRLQYWKTMYGFDHDSYRQEQDGKDTVYTYESLNHLPVCVWIRAEGKDHSYSVEKVPTYYDFMKHYTKDSEGELYYDGIRIVSRRTMGYIWNAYYGEVY